MTYTENFVTSADGTKIGYRTLGSGPEVVLLHGSMESAHSHLGMARSLAGRFTVHLPDRRGRGMSGPYPAGFGMRTEVEDLAAVLAQTQASSVFGVSSGGLIVLEAARVLPGIRTRAAAWFPRGLLTAATKVMMKSQDKKAAPGEPTMRALAPTLHYECLLLTEMTGKAATFADVAADVLLLTAGKGLSWLRPGFDALAMTLPSVTRHEFADLDHGGSGDRSKTNPGGKPEVVAATLAQFFARGRPRPPALLATRLSDDAAQSARAPCCA